jgi:catechol 2,3-dioxygenase-like lactoylglutathione lyase family enzyme
MRQRIGLVTLVVSDYDEAISYYTRKLGFALVEDTPIGAGKRWVIVAPQGASESGLLLAKAANERQLRAVGSQAGGRVFLFLHTDNFQRDYAAYKERGVTFHEEPREEAYGVVAVFTDLYGNRWDLIEPKAPSTTLRDDRR